MVVNGVDLVPSAFADGRTPIGFVAYYEEADNLSKLNLSAAISAAIRPLLGIQMELAFEALQMPFCR